MVWAWHWDGTKGTDVDVYARVCSACVQARTPSDRARSSRGMLVAEDGRGVSGGQDGRGRSGLVGHMSISDS